MSTKNEEENIIESEEIVSEDNEISGKESRIKIIEELEKERGGSHIISFITGTRTNLDFPIAMDTVRKFYDHLKAIKEKDSKPKIDLFIHSNGGDGVVPWKLVTLIREYAEEFKVLVPHRAFSAATLISLGADAIIMHPMGMLGPTDPTVTNPFNPQNPRNQNELLGISVEDVSAYVNLIKDDFGITHEDELIQAVNILADKVHPLALGNVKRFHAQSRMLAKKLLRLHVKDGEDHKIDKIVDSLTSKLFFHGHPINRNEAKKDLDLKIEDPTEKIEQLMWDLYLEYEKEMQLDVAFNPVDSFMKENPDLQANANAIMDMEKVKGVYVESLHKTDVFTLDFQIFGAKAQNGTTQTQLIKKREGWENE